MDVAIRYQSRSGNTQRVAQAIGQAVGVDALSLEAPLSAPVSLLFLGGAVYAGAPHESLLAFIDTLSPQQVSCVALFCTAASKKSIFEKAEAALEQRGISVCDQTFHCKGKFLLAHKHHPDAADCAQAQQFAQSVIAQHQV